MISCAAEESTEKAKGTKEARNCKGGRREAGKGQRGEILRTERKSRK